MSEQGNSSPLSSPPPSSPGGVTGDQDGTPVQATSASGRTPLEELSAEDLVVVLPNVAKAAVGKPVAKKAPAKQVAKKPVDKKAAVKEPANEEPVLEDPEVEEPVAKKATAKKPVTKKAVVKESAVKEPAVEDPAVEEPVVKKAAAKKPVAEKPAVRESTAEEPTVEDPVVDEPAVEEPAIKKPATKKPTVKKTAVKKATAAKRSAVEKRAVKEPGFQGPESPERELATPLAAPSASPENKSGLQPSSHLKPREPERTGSTSWKAINLPPPKARSDEKPEVSTCEGEEEEDEEEEKEDEEEEEEDEEEEEEDEEEEEEEAPVPSSEPEVPAREEKATASSVEKPAVEEPAVKRSAVKRSAVKKPATKNRSVKKPKVEGPGEPEKEAAAPSAEPSAAPSSVSNKRKPETSTREEEEKEDEEAAAPSASSSPVSKKRKTLPASVNSNEDVAGLRTKLKLTRGACTPCRDNKLKCLKEKPICSRCAESGTHCVYAFEQPRKGISTATRPALSNNEHGSEPKSLGPPSSHAYFAVQNLAVDGEVNMPENGAAAVTDPSINANWQAPEEAVPNDGAQKSTGTHRSVSSDVQPDTEPRKRKASDQAKPTSAKKPRQAGAVPRRTNIDKKWEAPFVYTDEHSPLTNADLRAILLLPQAWDVLTPEERKDILAKFPDDGHILNAGTEDARPDLVSLRNNDHFRYDCARYLENIERGRHDEHWLQEAWVAHEKHKRGDYDDFLRKEFENDWATKIPEGLLQKTNRKNETFGRDPAETTFGDNAMANGQHKALSGRAKGASAVQDVSPVNSASVDAIQANGTSIHIAGSTSNPNGAQYTALRFKIPQEAD